MYTLSIMILSYLYFKIFLKQNFKFCPAADFLFQARPADRPGRPAPAQDMHACACLLADRPGRPTVCRFALGFSGSTARVDRLQKPVFLFIGRSTRPVDRSPTATASKADGRPDRSTAKPAKAQRLFPLLCNSKICLFNLFWQTFSEVLEIFFRTNKLKINCF